MVKFDNSLRALQRNDISPLRKIFITTLPAKKAYEVALNIVFEWLRNSSILESSLSYGGI